MVIPTNNNLSFPQTGSFSMTPIPFTPSDSAQSSRGNSYTPSPSFSPAPNLSGLYYGKIVCMTTWLNSMREIREMVDLKESKLAQIKAQFAAHPAAFEHNKSKIEEIENDIRLAKNTIDWARKRAYTYLQPGSSLKPRSNRLVSPQILEDVLTPMDCDDSNPQIRRKRKENQTPDASQSAPQKKQKTGNPTVQSDLIGKLYKIGHRIYFKKEYGIILGFDKNRSEFTILLDSEKEPKNVNLNERNFYFIPQAANEKVLVKFKRIQDKYFPAKVVNTELGAGHITHTLEFDCKPTMLNPEKTATHRINFRNIYTLMPAPTDETLFIKSVGAEPPHLNPMGQRTFFTYKLPK